MLPSLQITQNGQRQTLKLNSRSGLSLLIANTATTRKSPLAVICQKASEANRLVEEIRFFNKDLRVHLFPDWETLPFDTFSPHQDLISQRLETLYQIDTKNIDVLVVPVVTALYYLPPREFLNSYVFFLKIKDTLDLDDFREKLQRASYSPVSQVLAPGEYAIKGGIIDVFPMGSVLPYRIDLFDTEIDSIRTFDVDTQRSIYKVNEIRLLPAKEFPTDDAARTKFRTKYREIVEGDPSKSLIYREISKGSNPPGIEYYLPLFFDEISPLLDYLDNDWTLILEGNLESEIREFWNDADSRYRLLRGEVERPLLDPARLFLREAEFFTEIKKFSRLKISTSQEPDNYFESLPDLSINRRLQDPLTNLKHFLTEHNKSVVLIADSPGRRETLKTLFHDHSISTEDIDEWKNELPRNKSLFISVGLLDHGFILKDSSLAIITESELYPQQTRVRSKRDRKTSSENLVRDLSEIRKDDPIVHLQHGIGRYKELIMLDLGEGDTEFLTIEYADGDILYVPVSQLEMISRYSGGPPETAPIHRLGSDKWDKAKKKAAKQIRDTAAELLNIYAQRASKQGLARRLDKTGYASFCEDFPFTVTIDQHHAIEDTIADLQSDKPMDRLICGDVGFGKTEVALRAAYVAVADNAQVAVLVPTTLLAEQHFQTFSDRFANLPVEIRELSRFRSRKEVIETIDGLKTGKVDIVIGTHKLLSKEIQFDDLGLVIVDEEHRFGVRHKEALKSLRADTDILTLTATPIPRTLAMSMEGLRDFSVITTPPEKRLSIKTFVMSFNRGMIREAALRELKRGGQIYYLHNEVDTIERELEKLNEILPEASIRIAHGQMHERDLEFVMRDFYQGRFNILLCTTIIETGIDIPTANTIIINRAEKFGLAQLHQLRGRVGRSHHQAYAYLMTTDGVKLKGPAKKRLEAIQLMEDLGSGFFLAMHDLEIRGAGEVLGDSQSGDLQEIGFQLYVDMLDRAVQSLKLGKEPNIDIQIPQGTEIVLHTPTLLTNNYCPDVHERLIIYKRLANASTQTQLEKIEEELIDRFGLLPPETKALLASHKLRIVGKLLGISKIDSAPNKTSIAFHTDPLVDPMEIIELVQKRNDIRFSGPSKLICEHENVDLAEERVRYLQEILSGLTQPSS
ncbi:MAG: transcription-repair coupling factor [Burkholderiales bacterium]|jgi:transcription-repair coupling factor (superfamily II helicase)|tara:strand:- start:215 stop:3634 length:3420 start_codon:yes stop_codon:yes gene_type:complete